MGLPVITEVPITRSEIGPGYTAFPEDNNGNRSSQGVYKTINTLKQEIKNQRGW